MIMKQFFLLVYMSFLSILVAEQPNFILSSGFSIPLGPVVEDVNEVAYQPGLKVDGLLNAPIASSRLALLTQFGFNQAPLSEDANSNGLILLSAQTGPSLSIIKNEKANLSISTLGGAYLGLLDGSMGSYAMASGRVDLNMILSTGLELGVGGNYSYYLSSNPANMDHLWSGAGVNINLSYRSNSSQNQKGRLEIKDTIIFPIYPVLHSSYNKNDLGTITVVNKERSSIDNITISLYIPKYMSGFQSFETGESMQRDEEKTFSIHGLLDSSILEETEGTQVEAEIRVSYELKDNELAVSQGNQAEILYRNALSWNDDRKAASFVTSREPAVMAFAKNTTSSVRDNNNTAMDSSLVNAIIIYEALSLYGIKYQVDPNSSYQELSGSGDVLDYLQFPVETLTYRSGDCDDLTVLYSSILESLAVETAMITIPGHIYSAIALKMSPEEAKRTFSQDNRLIYTDDKVWIPVETTMLDSNSFLDAWNYGAQQWNRAGDKAKLYPIEDAWKLYPAVALNAYRNREISIPQANQLRANYLQQMNTLIDQETAEQVAYLEKAIRESRGERRNRMINSLAVLKARYGQYDAALESLLPITSEEDPYLPAIINRANLYYQLDDMEQAKDFYQLARKIDPQQPKAALGEMLVEYEQGNIDNVQKIYNQIKEISPAIAERYSYLVNESSSINRAAEAGSKENILWEE